MTAPVSFYELYRAIETDTSLSPKARAAAELALVEEWLGDPKGMCVSLLDHPEHAILPTALGTFVTKFRDVSEVLEHDDVFGVRAGYGERMAITTGAFMLGMDAGPDYDRETALIRLAMPASDLPAIRVWLRDYAERVIAQIAAAGTSIDIVQDVGYRLPTAFVGRFLGVPGPSEAAWIGWQQMLAMYVFNFWTGGSPFKEDASITGLRYQTYIADTIRQRWAAIAGGADPSDDLLSRLIVRAIGDPGGNLDEVAIRRNLGGLAIGSTIAPSQNIIFALDYIIGLRDSDPATFATIDRAAQDDDDDLLLACMLEASRLSIPVPPTLFRIAATDFTIAKGTPRAKTIPAGTTVVVVPAAATMDGDVIDAPEKFRIDRPSWTYLVYGDGLHRCMGRAIGNILLVEAARAVLRLPDVRRSSGPAGHIARGIGLPGGAYPAHLIFDFDRPPAQSV